MGLALLVMLLAADAGNAPDARTPEVTAPARNRGVVARQWKEQRTPSVGPARAIGGYSLGCVGGAVALPVSGPGFETLRIGRNRRFGHPDLVAYVRRLARGAATHKLGLMVVGDLAQPRGGPTPSGHRSHQTGLDVDIGYVAPDGARAGRVSAAARERLSPPAVVDLKTHLTTRAWSSSVAKVLALAADDPVVDRIFVNPAIKRILCEIPAYAQAPWQARLRPWWAHHDHFHVRLKCPADSPLCVPQDPPPDDGCGTTLAWWFSDDAQSTHTKKVEAESAEAEPVLPEACADVLKSEAVKSAALASP